VIELDFMNRMSVIICPGIHHPELTLGFVEGLRREGMRGNNSLLTARSSSDQKGNLLIFPAQDYPAYSAFHILQFLDEDQSVLRSPLVFISFSAGVVGAIGAAWGWQLKGGHVKAFIALDGWGVPLSGNFPIHRLSHDYFTNWSSSLLGSGSESFYAQPPVEHLDLWRSPETVQGWCIPAPDGAAGVRVHMSAAQFLTMLLAKYQ